MPADPSSPDRYHRYRRYVTGIGVLYKKKKARVYTGIILSIFTIAFFGFFAIRPTLVTIGGLLKEIKDKREVVAQMDQKINNLNKAQTNYTRIEKDLDLVNESLPLDPDLPILIKQLESLARLSSVAVESVRFEKTNLQGEIETEEGQASGFSVTLVGDYKNLKDFLSSLDTLRRIISVKSFGFTSKTEEEIQLLILSISAEAHYLLP
ncbi:type 4a pilus biogenesis protein PilO [Patescibacteria group bacterium]|nr:type 4a pilus biogenesis protein PilO [Patescibacteria group bacterium]